MVAYTIMDIISKCVFTFMIVAAHDALEIGRAHV